VATACNREEGVLTPALPREHARSARGWESGSLQQRRQLSVRAEEKEAELVHASRSAQDSKEAAQFYWCGAGHARVGQLKPILPLRLDHPFWSRSIGAVKADWWCIWVGTAARQQGFENEVPLEDE
jgi:hypothetical protein